MGIEESIIEDLQKESASVRELIQRYGLLKKEVISHLEHISKAILPKRRLQRLHACCRNCGFVFSERVSYDTPTKCPKCRGEAISEVRFRIIG